MTVSRPAPSTPARSPTRRTGAGHRPDLRDLDLRAGRRRRPARRATSTRAPATPRAPRWRRRWPRSRAARTAWPSRRAWRPRTRSCARVCARATTSSSPHDAYGGTFRLISTGATRLGRRVHRRSTSPTSTPCARRSGRTTKLVWCETPTNPLLSIADIAALGALAREHGAMLVVDNTFASPYLQQPLALGADVVVHSTTKYLGGHSDVVGGALVTDDAELDASARASMQNAHGRGARPVRRFLTCAASRPSRVRMERHCDNAERDRRRPRRPPGGRLGALPGPAPTTRATRSPPSRCAASAGWSRLRLAGGEQAARDFCARDPDVHARRVPRRRGVARSSTPAR